MANAVNFHHIHGANVILNENKTMASWIAGTSGGVILGEYPMQNNSYLVVEAEGYGRVEVGFITRDPSSLPNGIPDSVTDLPTYQAMNEMRFHKRNCLIYMIINSDGTKIISSFRDAKFSIPLERDDRVWPVVYIMFGKITVSVKLDDGSPFTLLPICGVNIQLDGTRTIASIINPNPAAVCATNTPLGVGDTLILRCGPVNTYRDKTVSSFSLKLMVSNKDPAYIQSDSTDALSISKCSLSSSFLTVIETLRKIDCCGYIEITLKSDNLIEYRTANSKINSQSLNFAANENGVWVYLELYRVTVQCLQLFNSAQVRTDENAFYLASEKPDRLSGSSEYLDVICGPRSTPDIRFELEADSKVCVATRRRNSESNRVSEDEDESDDYLVVQDKTPLRMSRSFPSELDYLSTRNAGNEETGNGETGNGKIMEKLSTIETKVDTLDRKFTSVGFDFVDSPPIVRRHSDESVIDISVPIRRNHVRLVNDIQTEAMNDHMYQYSICSQSEYNRVRQKTKDDFSAANRMILDILSKKSIKKSVLTKILQDIGDEHLIPLFFKS